MYKPPETFSKKLQWKMNLYLYTVYGQNNFPISFDIIFAYLLAPQAQVLNLDFRKF